MIDINPFISYRLTGRITPGIGWNDRITINDKRVRLNGPYRMYGPRMFVDVRVAAAFILHIENEFQNISVSNPASSEKARRVWVSTTMAGIKKEYKLSKHFV